METRANYVIIGGFVLGILFAAFLFIYWLAATADSRSSVNVKVVFPGPVTGLPVGGQVLFNGIKVGDVGALDFDPNDPRIVIATIRVTPTAPLRKDVKATLGFQGLTGVAYVDLTGGTTGTDLLLSNSNGQEPVIYADRSFFDDIIDHGREVLRKADRTLASVDTIIQENRPAVAATVRNAEVFSAALAQNADGVKEFMSSIGEATTAFKSLAGRMEGLVSEGERILAAVPADKVDELVGNVTAFSQSLRDAGPEIERIVADAESATANINQFTERLNGSLSQIEAVVNAVDPQAVTRVVDGAAALGDVLASRSPDIDRVIASTAGTMENLDQITDTVRAREADFLAFLTEGRQLVDELLKTVQSAGGVVAAVDPARVGNILANVDRVITDVSAQGEAITATVSSARAAAANIETFTRDLNARRGDVDQIITDARTVSGNLTTASDKLNGLMDNVNSMVEGNGEGLIVEATKAAAAIRKIAETFESRAGGIADGLSKFAQQGSTDFAATLDQINRTFAAIQRAVDNFDRAPNRVIFGGDEVPRFNGAQRR
ncbi:MCE family protein [Microvirga tunisiensis]|uniref:MCE family protein n=2 Tax=Pannonibacter tanglangensis TaxID=2750084 RepID=A0ABW9ZF80_9HYPH|nr:MULTISPECIES: MlaD family protein [unclassified Pannonibacter]NBN63505.1 MCE family protein [Pannonibacter sp. XCT-34]NBN77142.1 MCE family protein [Pannonibacter sp. XCT-53]